MRQGGNVIKSTDKGSTWTQTSDYDGFQNGGFIVVMKLRYSDPNIIYENWSEDLMPPFMLNVSYDAAIRGTTLKKVIRVTQNTLMIIG